MIFIAWLAAYILAFGAEISFLPVFLNFIPPLSFSVLILGMAMQGFAPGFWFTGLAGFSRDLIAPQTAGSHVLFFLAIFFIVHAFAFATHLEEPLRKISKVVIGFIAAPVIWVLIGAGIGTFFAPPVQAVRWTDMPRLFAPGDYLFISAVVIIFVCVLLRSFRRARGNEFGRL